MNLRNASATDYSIDAIVRNSTTGAESSVTFDVPAGDAFGAADNEVTLTTGIQTSVGDIIEFEFSGGSADVIQRNTNDTNNVFNWAFSGPINNPSMGVIYRDEVVVRWFEDGSIRYSVLGSTVAVELPNGPPADWDKIDKSPVALTCLPQTTLTPAAEWTLTGGVQANGDSLLIGSGGQQDGIAEYDYVVPVGNRSTNHAFSFTLREVDAAGNDIALRVEIEQAGSVFVSRDLLTTEVAQSITLDFVPTANVKIRIRDTSTGTQGSNRDALVSAMQVAATCHVGSLASTPTDSVVHSIVQTDNIDDSTVGSKITIVTGTAVHLGTQEVTFATNGDITLPQQPQPYILKWYGGFDMDGDPDQETRVAFAGPTLYSLDATADAFDTTVEGSDDNSGANTTFSIFQWMRPVAIAVIDASAGPVTTSLTFTEGGAGVGPTGGTIEIENIGGSIADAGVATNEEVTQQLAALQNQFDINDIVLTTIPDLQFDVKTGEKWVFEVNLLAGSLDATADLRAGTIAPAGSTGRITFVNAENATVRGADINDATLSLAVALGTDDLIQLKGIVNAGGDGVVQFQLRNNAGTVLQSFRADSWVEAKKIS